MSVTSPSTILLVDDHEAGRYAVARTLTAAGFDVVEAATGTDAIRLAGHGPDLVLLDVNLPDMSGFEVCSHLKSDPGTRHLPVVHLSSTYVRSEHVAEGLEAGADGYLTQPVDSRQLVATINAVLRLYAAEHELRQQGALLDSVVRSSQDAIFVRDLEGAYLFRNASAEAVLGTADAPPAAGSAEAAQAQPAGGDQAAHDALVIASGRPETFEEHVTADDGSERVLLTVRGPLYDDAGEPYGVYGVARDITERKRAEDEIRRLNAELETRVAERTEELEETNRELESFAYSVSHDLRAPLRAIDGFSQVLVEDYSEVLDDQGHERLGRIRAAAQRMAELIDDLLRLSRTSRGELHRAWVDLSSMAHEIAAELSAAEPSRSVEYTVADGLRAFGDPDLLHVVLVNLLSNAQKFTSRRPTAHIEVGSAEVDGRTAFYVRDDGAGFDVSRSDELFVAFGRLHQEADFPGTGIGLATVQRIVHRHHGRVWAESAEGEGATFWFTIGSHADAAAGRDVSEGGDDRPAGSADA